MRCRRLVTPIILVLGVVSSASGQESNASATRAAEAAAVQKERSVWEGIQRKDWTGLDRILSGTTYVARTGILAEWKAGVAAAAFSNCVLKTYAMDSVRTRMINPNQVLLTYRAVADWSCGGQKEPSPTYETGIWQKSGGNWVIVYASSVPVAGGR